MAELTVQEMDLSGLNPSFSSAASGGDSFRNDGNTFLYVKNGDSSQHTVTLNIQKTIELGGITLSITNPTVDVPAGENRMIGPFPLDWLNDADKLVNIDYDAVTSVTVAAIKV